MALTINPAVSGGVGKWMRHSLVFFLGVVSGALVSATALVVLHSGAAQLLAERYIAIGAVLIVGLGVMVDLGLPLRLPYRAQQVPEWFRDHLSPGAVAAVFGFQLGVGFLTLFTYSTHLAAFLAIAFLDSTTAVIAAVLAFAAGKCVVLLLTVGAPTIEEVSLRLHSITFRPKLLRLTTASTSILLMGALLAEMVV